VSSFLTGYRPYILLTLLCLAFFAPGQSALPPVDRDEARFAQATRQMLQTGDYINIRFQDTPRHKKPAAIYWLQAASVGLFGETNASVIWPYRLPSVLGAIAAVLLTFALGCVLFERRVAFLGAAVLASSSLLVIEAHLAKTDAVLLATIMAAMLALARIYAAARMAQDIDRREERESGRFAPLVFWGALGVSALVKGPVGPMVVLLTVAALWITDWRAGRVTDLFARLKPLVGIPLAVAIFAPWLIAIMSATGGSFVGDAVKSDLLPKLISGQESHGFPPGYFLLLLTGTMWPGSLFVWHGIVWAWQNRWEWPVKFCVAWAAALPGAGAARRARSFRAGRGRHPAVSEMGQPPGAGRLRGDCAGDRRRAGGDPDRPRRPLLLGRADPFVCRDRAVDLCARAVPSRARRAGAGRGHRRRRVHLRARRPMGVAGRRGAVAVALRGTDRRREGRGR
jgi:4-amino-4-deoxy-L-arabinose transferase-like glycosyltransferase